MKNVLILLDSLSHWRPYYQTKSIITATDYLQHKSLTTNPALVINLCTQINYNSEGYYCSLLAQARGHKVIPNAEVLNKLESGAGIRMDAGMHKTCFQWIEKNNITTDNWFLDIYFGTCVEKQLERIARFIFEQFPYPVLRVVLNNRKRNQIESVIPLKLTELNDYQQTLFADALDSFNKKVWRNPRLRKTPRYELAIFHNPEEPFPPSNKKALTKFVEIAKRMNIHAELITEADITKLMEFDALFMRQTTSLNHITYHVCQKAKQADLVVIDDPLSIIRCTNKVYINELLQKEGILCPRSLLLFRKAKYSYSEVVKHLGKPFILKIPDGSFSHGISKVNDHKVFHEITKQFFEKSSIIIAQEFLPTEFDWRIGVLNGEAIFACKYYMVNGHWQIYYHQKKGKTKSGLSETIPIYQVPKTILKNAVKAASLIGKGLYGVDLKMINDEAVVIEINDNPSIDYGIEDAILGDELYYRILNEFVRSLEQKHQ
jgi:glutathione synthase/RimK-type ligase-like ATP-grasp enzyme